MLKKSCSRSGLVVLNSERTDKTVGLHSFDLVYRFHMGRDNRGRKDLIAKDAESSNFICLYLNFNSCIHII